MILHKLDHLDSSDDDKPHKYKEITDLGLGGYCFTPHTTGTKGPLAEPKIGHLRNWYAVTDVTILNIPPTQVQLVEKLYKWWLIIEIKLNHLHSIGPHAANKSADAFLYY